MNVHDSERIAGLLLTEGYALTEDRKKADLIVFNTCSVRQKAEQKFLSELGKIRAMKKHRPALKVAVAGCIARQMGEKLFKRSPHVDYVLGPQNIHTLKNMVKNNHGIAVEENPDIAEMELPVLRKDKGRAWVNIMYGCDNFCTYCIVPYTRGREKSRPAENILKEIKELAEKGFKEVTLLGQNVNSYKGLTGKAVTDINSRGGPLPPLTLLTLSGLLERINNIEGMERIRFVTSHPRDFTDDLINSIAGLRKVCEYVHLPLQSGSTRVLGLMNRGYTADDYREKIDRLRQKVPGVAITSDILVGFPTETDKDHRETIKALEDIEFDGIYAFKFSPRPGTAASVMEEQVSEDIKLERLQEVFRLQDEITLAKNKILEGSVQEILVEGPGKTPPEGVAPFTGRTRTNKIVNFTPPENSSNLIGKLITVRIFKAKRHSLEGEVK